MQHISIWFSRHAKCPRLYVEPEYETADYPNDNARRDEIHDYRHRPVLFQFYFKRRFHSAYVSGSTHSLLILQIPFVTFAWNPPDPFLN